jgi:Fe-S-cluster containining protein
LGLILKVLKTWTHLPVLETMSKYECKQCGKCCRDLLQTDRGILRGLTLLPDEVDLFPEDMVKPYLGLGKRPYESGFTVIAYQLAVEECTKLVENMCTVYETRPTTCRQFPFSLDIDEDNDPVIGIDMNCPAASEMVSSLDGQVEFTDRIEAEKLFELSRKVTVNPRKAWIYDLGSMKWVRFDRIG